ncbi:proline-rich membrane anchor 1 [Arapaima gigas]
MLLPHMVPLSCAFWPVLFGHCVLTSILLLVQCTQGDLQKSCSRTVAAKVNDACQLACQCRPYPPLPPPPPPPPPPRLLVSTVVKPSEPKMKPWWKDVVILCSVGSTSGALILLAAVICYKAIKRKPLRKEENGTSRGEYAMSSRCEKQGLDTNNAVV